MAYKEPKMSGAKMPPKHKAGSVDVGKHGHSDGSEQGHVPHAGHGLHPSHPMLHHDNFHKNENHG